MSPGVPHFHLNGPLETNRASSTVDKSAKGHYPCLAADLFFRPDLSFCLNLHNASACRIIFLSKTILFYLTSQVETDIGCKIFLILALHVFSSESVCSDLSTTAKD